MVHETLPEVNCVPQESGQIVCGFQECCYSYWICRFEVTCCAVTGEPQINSNLLFHCMNAL